MQFYCKAENKLIKGFAGFLFLQKSFENKSSTGKLFTKKRIVEFKI